MASPSSTQPMKKQRGGSTPISRSLPRKTDVGLEADDAIARRRAELRRLNDQRNKKAATRGRPAPSTASRPPPTSTADLMKPSTSMTKSTRSRSTGRAPPPPPVARKLEFNKSGNVVVPNNRAKSVPPRRPAAAPPRATKTTVNKSQQQLPPRSSRPAPVDPTSLISSKTTTTMVESAPPVFHATAATAATAVESSSSKKPTQQSLPPPSAVFPEPTLVEETTKTPAAEIPMTPAAASMPPSSTTTTTTTTAEPPNTTSRRDRMKQLRDGLEGPTASTSKPSDGLEGPTASTSKPSKTEEIDSLNPMVSSANARLEEELKKTEVERNEAFQKIKELEDKLTEKAKTTIQQTTAFKDVPIKDMTSLQEIMELFKTQGEDAAMKYAESKLQKQQPPKQAGFLTPMLLPSTPTTASTSSSNRSSNVVQRVATPHPNRGVGKGKVRPTDEDIERKFINTFREAVKFCPHEFYGPLLNNSGMQCVYFVRRPYGLPEQNGIFELVSPTTLEAYSKRAHVGDPTTIEVAVGIPFDDSVLCLAGSMGVRYRITPTGAFESKPFVKEPLGSICYIDESANEQEYSLDQILQEALSVREQYCASMMSTGLGFEQRKLTQPAATATATSQDGASVPAPKPEMADVAVDTSDMPIPKEIALEKSEKKEEKKKKESKPKPSDPEELSGAGDVVIAFIGIVIKSFFGLIRWIFIDLPLTTIRASIVFCFAGAVVGMLYLYALQYHHEALLGGGNSFYYSSSASYHTNIAPGIL